MSPLAHALAAALYAAEGKPVTGRALARRLRCSQAALESETTTTTTIRKWCTTLRQQGVEVRIGGDHTADGSAWRVTAVPVAPPDLERAFRGIWAAAPSSVHKE